MLKNDEKMINVLQDNKKVYIVLSHTGSIVSKLIKLFTRKEFSHASISLTEDLQWMFSFGRIHPYNPFWGGFVRESLDKGALKRFRDARAAILEVEVSSEEFEGIRKTIETMLHDQKKYHYNYLGLFKAGMHLPHNRSEYRYYCSEFVRDILQNNHVSGLEGLPKIVHPVNFLELPYEVVYRGRLCDYSKHIS